MAKTAKQSPVVEQSPVVVVPAEQVAAPVNPVLTGEQATQVAAQSSAHAAAIVAAAVADVNTDPVPLADVASRIAAFVVVSERVAADATVTAEQVAASLADIASCVAVFFAGHCADLKTYTARRKVFDTAVADAFATRAKQGDAVAAESVKRHVRRILAAAEVKKPESAAPKDVKAKAMRQTGAILGALHAKDPAALAAAIKKAGGDDCDMVADLREQYADQFEQVETHGARRAALLALIESSADDSPTMSRLYAAAML